MFHLMHHAPPGQSISFAINFERREILSGWREEITKKHLTTLLYVYQTLNINNSAQTCSLIPKKDGMAWESYQCTIHQHDLLNIKTG